MNDNVQNSLDLLKEEIRKILSDLDEESFDTFLELFNKRMKHI